MDVYESSTRACDRERWPIEISSIFTATYIDFGQKSQHDLYVVQSKISAIVRYIWMCECTPMYKKWN
jgi:hypothetical protein